jgi:hypothetical protein
VRRTHTHDPSNRRASSLGRQNTAAHEPSRRCRFAQGRPGRDFDADAISQAKSVAPFNMRPVLRYAMTERVDDPRVSLSRAAMTTAVRTSSDDPHSGAAKSRAARDARGVAKSMDAVRSIQGCAASARQSRVLG